jgi:hypothetical protein
MNGNVMNRVINFFDYIFYRVYSFFNKKGDNIADVKAANLVTILQGFIFIDLFMIVRKIHPFEIPKEYFNKWIWGLPLALIIGYLNHLRYKKKLQENRFSTFEEKWNQEDKKTQLVKGWLIILLIFFLIFGVIILMITI